MKSVRLILSQDIFTRKIHRILFVALLSLIYKTLATAQPTYLHSLISVQPLVLLAPQLTVVILSRSPTISSLRITNRSFRYASPHLWNQLPISFRQPCTIHPADDVTVIYLPPAHHSHPPSNIHFFIPGSKLTFSTNLFHHSLLAPTWSAFSDYTGPDLLCSTVFHF